MDKKDLYTGIDPHVLAGYVASIVERAVNDKKKNVSVESLIKAFEFAKNYADEDK